MQYKGCKMGQQEIKNKVVLITGQREMKDMECNNGMTKIKDKGELMGQRMMKDKWCINKSTKMNDIL